MNIETNLGSTEKVRIFDKNEQNANSLEIPGQDGQIPQY